MQATAEVKYKMTKKVALITLFITSQLSGCANFLLGNKTFNRNPIENPVVNVTNFSNSLACMDNLLIQYDIPTITITAQDIPNMTGEGEQLVGGKEMLITSMSKIGSKSQRIRFVSYGTDLRDIILLHKAHDAKENFITPDYFIRGGITQLDKNVISSRFGTALNSEDWNAAFTGGQGISYAALDLNVGQVSSLQMIPGVTSNNVLAVYDKGAGTDLGGRINSVGTFFDFGLDRRDGLGQAIRNLVDLGLIELIGKLLDIPYMTCLPLDYENPEVLAKIREEYVRYSKDRHKLIKSIQMRLKQFNYYHGATHGILDRKTYLALEYYRNLYSLNSFNNGTQSIDFKLYKEIMYGNKYAWDFDSVTYPRFTELPEEFIEPELKYNSIRAEQKLEQRYKNLQQNKAKDIQNSKQQLKPNQSKHLAVPRWDPRVSQGRFKPYQ